MEVKQVVLIPNNISKKRFESILNVGSDNTVLFCGYSKKIETINVSNKDFNLMKEMVSPISPQGINLGLHLDKDYWESFTLTNSLYIDILKISKNGSN